MVLVTGATGFLGSELVMQLCKKGLSVKCLKRESSKIPEILVPFEKQLTWHTADILDFDDLESAFDGVNKVYHCAAMVSLNDDLKKKLIYTNVQGTANVVNICLAKADVRLLHVSSIAALGEGKNGKTVDENVYWEGDHTAGGYAISKYESEMEVWRGITEGLDALIVNPSIILGAAAGKTGSGQIFEMIKKGFPYYTNGGTGLVDVEDVAAIMIKLMDDTAISGERFIINAENLTYKTFFSKIATALNKEAPKKVAKPWMLTFARRIEQIKAILSGKPSGFTKDAAKSALKTNFFNSEKLSKHLNHQFKPIDNTIAEIAKSIS